LDRHRTIVRLLTAADLAPLIEDMLEVARLAGIVLCRDGVEVQFHQAPHRRPAELPSLRQAVYGFVLDGRCLKVGKAGASSAPRYTSHHYNPRSSGSNLAKCLLRAGGRLRGEVATELVHAVGGLSEEDVGGWIEQNTTRFNLLVGVQHQEYELSLLETFIQSRLRPVFEGRGRR
jgi:hypothetical protein